MKTLFALAILTLTGCAHLTRNYATDHDAAMDDAFALELDRLTSAVHACYQPVAPAAHAPVALELAVDEAGRPVAARALDQMFGTGLGGCMETVAFRVQLPAGPNPRLARAVVRPEGVAVTPAKVKELAEAERVARP